MHYPHSSWPPAPRPAQWFAHPTLTPTWETWPRAPTAHQQPPPYRSITRDQATVNLRDTPDCVKVDVDLPRLIPADIHLTIQDHRVRIQGAPAAVAGQPRSDGIDRTLEFATPIEATQVEVTPRESTVTITLPKRRDTNT